MKIGLIGGTGDIGEGLALRWGLNTEHALLIGSRKADKARERAEEFARKLEIAGRKAKSGITGGTNEDVVKDSEIVVLCVEAPYVVATLRELLGVLSPDKIVVTPAVSMVRKGGVFLYAPPPDGSMAVQLARVLPEAIPLVSAFHTVPAHKLADLSATLDQDVVVLGDMKDAKERIMGLVAEIDGLHPIDGGPLVTSSLVESITPLLINLAIVNKRKNLAIKFV
ncbi:MAG: NADPH-dependent F420 reductase [Deltaproteobacteria bacterium]|nr:NADPH-dependent F420 reductase [Deltaproteobacteria bacterium]